MRGLEWAGVDPSFVSMGGINATSFFNVEKFTQFRAAAEVKLPEARTSKGGAKL
jgi:hypothetical protein